MLKAGPLPKYFQLAEQLRRQISTKQWLPNDQLPTEDGLCQQYQVSRGTVRQAIRTLIDEGLIRREQGRGTFVAASQSPSTLFTLTSFDETMRRQNRQPSTHLLTAETVPATADMANRLAVPLHEPLMHIVRLRLADEQPVVYEERYLAQALCPQLLAEDLSQQSIHGLLVNNYQIPLVKMTHTVELRPLLPDQAALLKTQPNRIAFFVDRLTYTRQAEQLHPAVWFKGIYRQDSYNLEAQAQPLSL